MIGTEMEARASVGSGSQRQTLFSGRPASMRCKTGPETMDQRRALRSPMPSPAANRAKRPTIQPKWMFLPQLYLRSVRHFWSLWLALDKERQEVGLMGIAQIQSDRSTVPHAVWPTVPSQERLQLFAAEVDRRQRAAIFGCCTGFGLVASIAMLVLGRLFA